MFLSANAGENRIGREFFRYALPSVAGMVVSSLYTVVDGIFVGRGVGEIALGSVNIVYPFIMLQIAITMMVAVGGANLFSLSRGRGDFKAANNVFCQSLGLLVSFAAVFNLLALFFGSRICTLLGADEVLLPQAREYLRWMALFGIVYMPGLGVSIFVRNDGAPNLELAGTLSGAVVNIVLDYLFIMVYDGGVAGAAIASGIGQIVSVCIYFTHFLRRNRTLALQMPIWHAPEVFKILRNGFSSFLMEFSQSAVALSFNIVLVGRLGALGVAAYSIVMYICSLFNMVLIGIVQGAQPIMSYSHGLGNPADVRKIYRMGVSANLILSVAFYGGILLFGERLAGFFNKDNLQLTGMAVRMMRCYFLGFLPVGISLMNILYFQATERDTKSILISFLRCVGFVQAFLLILPPLTGEMGIYLSFFCGEFLNCLVSIAFYRRERAAVPARAPLPAATPGARRVAEGNA